MNRKKILLISANQFTVPYPVYPLGLSYISSYLQTRLHDYDIRIFDLVLNNIDELIKSLKKFKPDYIGISLRNIDDVNIYNKESFIINYKNIINEIKKNTKSKIIIGGSGFSIFPETLFEYLKPDFGIYGEGEESFYKLIYSLDNNLDYRNIEGLVYLENNNIILTKRTKYFKNPDFCFEKNLIDYYWKHSGMLNIQSKRGCPYECVYCTYPLIEGSKVRLLNTDKIIEALSDIYFNKGIDYIFFTDSVFNINNDFNFELAEKIIKNKIAIRWGAYFSLHNLDDKLLILLKKAGLTHIEFGTESICNATLKSYGKPFTVSDIIEKSELCNKLEIDFAHFLILGGYGETEDTLNETYENSKRINRTVFFPFIGMRIYPGTKLHEIAIKEKTIRKDDNLLEPKYYISDKIDISTLKEKANKTGKRWVFPDEDMSKVMNKMRLKNKKGPLWEYLIK
ncbi:MAG: radical SAM protein [Bacteroidetes bacterium]|nr:radical SAM protein [Bacteroidota bacterium]MBL7104685.1 radical SAM protein [Bacteroidales bacterium]